MSSDDSQQPPASPPASPTSSSDKGRSQRDKPTVIAQRELNQETCQGLVEQALSILGQYGVSLPVRQRKLDELRRSHVAGVLQVGLLGITSSGKSALLNVVMGGTARLPEAASPTTSTRVVCWRGAKEQAWVYYQDGSVRVLEGETLAELEPLCDEREQLGANPVAYIEWTSPAAQIPPGVHLIDTPGLDPDIPLHDEMTRSAILPMLDVVVYVKPVRAPFAGADLRLLKQLLHDGQTVLLMLTKSDTVVDLSEGAQSLKSAVMRIADAEDLARAELAKYPGLRAAGVLTVSAHERRGLDSLGLFLMSLVEARPALLLLQKRRELKALLSAISDDLTDPQEGRERAQVAEGAASLAGDAAVLREKLRGALDRLRAKEARVRQRWVGALGLPRRLEGRVLKQIEADRDAAAKSKRAATSLRVGTALGRGATQEVAALIRDAINTLLGFGIPLREPAEEPPAPELTVKPDGYVESVPGRTVPRPSWAEFRRNRGFFRGTWAYLRAPLQTDEPGFDRFDKDSFVTHLAADVVRIETHIADRLAWLEQNVLALLQQRFAQEVDAQAEAQRARRTVDHKFREIVRKSLGEIYDLAAALPIPSGSPVDPLEPELEIVETESEPPHEAHEALFGLLETFAETAIQEEFRLLLRRLVPSAPEPLKVLLVGADRQPLLHLCSLLAHDAAKSEALRKGAPADKWLRIGAKAELPGLSSGNFWDEHGLNTSAIPLFRGLTIFVAPADEQLGALPVSLVRGCTAVGVHLDAARIGHARADLSRARSLYMNTLHEARIPSFFVNGTSRDFSGQLSQLLTEVPEALEAEYPDCTEWFLFDDYDVRYSRFVQIGRQVLAGKKSIPALWREAGLLFSGAFAEERLNEAISESRKRKRKTKGKVQEERVK